MNILENTVHEALDNALDNGYDMLKFTNMQIAIDLIEFDAVLEKHSAEELIPHIESWRFKKEPVVSPTN